MSFTKKSAVVARLDQHRQMAKKAAIQAIEDAMKRTTHPVLFVDLGRAADLHADDLQVIVEGYSTSGWKVEAKRQQPGPNEDSVLVLSFS